MIAVTPKVVIFSLMAEKLGQPIFFFCNLFDLIFLRHSLVHQHIKLASAQLLTFKIFYLKSQLAINLK